MCLSFFSIAFIINPISEMYKAKIKSAFQESKLNSS